MENIVCPICQSDEHKRFLTVSDYNVSRETFHIVECKVCAFKFTNPRPSENQIDKYYESDNYISHTDTSEGLINKLYKIVRQITLKQKRSLINSFKVESKTILDIGCGTGAFLNVMAQDGWKCVGIEPNKNARDKATLKFNIKAFDEASLVQGLGQFDVITLWHVLEHVHDLQKRILEIKLHMKSTSVLIVAVPNCESTDAKYYKEFWAAYDVPRHLYHFTPATMNEFMGRNGLEIIQKLMMPFDAFYVSMLSEKYKNKRQNLLNAFYRGLNSLTQSRKSVDLSSSIIYIIKVKN
jgi:2-polyprenyl-3-methyl-5-hydroxy-6-metoxy-1,4-benzoquinol methylase